MSRNAFDQLVRDELHDEDLREIARDEAFGPLAELAQKVEGLQHALRSARAVIEIREKHQLAESVVAAARETLDSEREANDLLTKELAECQAREKSLRAALNLLWSWANNWDSEFMNDPDWKNRDFEVIQQAAIQSADGSALTAALKAERERCIGAVEFADDSGCSMPYGCNGIYIAINAIRALG